MMRNLRFAATLLVAGLLVSCGAKKEAQKQDEAAFLSPADIVTVARVDLATGVPVNGTLEPAIDVSIIAPIAEVIETMLVKEGETVSRGQVLARFRTTALAPAAAGAQARRDAAAAEFERLKTLFGKGSVSQRELDSSESEFKAAEALAALATKSLEEATVRAPVDGVIATRFVQAGNRTGDGDPIFRLVNTRELEFEAVVPSDALGSIRVGARVELTVSGAGEAAFEGRVLRINPTVDAATRQGKVYVSVDNTQGRLAGDLFATGRIVLDQANQVLALPAAAVRAAGGRGYTAWAIEAGRLVERIVEPGLRDDLHELVEIRSGVAEGDTVIVSPVTLKAGHRIDVIGAEGAARPVTS